MTSRRNRAITRGEGITRLPVAPCLPRFQGCGTQRFGSSYDISKAIPKPSSSASYQKRRRRFKFRSTL
eukprot:3276652-Amphidinium_carterae.1